MMAFSGVRSSWLILVRKRDLAALAASAAFWARSESSSRFLIAVKSLMKKTKPPSLVRVPSLRIQRPSLSWRSALPSERARRPMPRSWGRRKRRIAYDVLLRQQRGFREIHSGDVAGDVGEEFAYRIVGEQHPSIRPHQEHALARGSRGACTSRISADSARAFSRAIMARILSCITVMEFSSTPVSSRPGLRDRGFELAAGDAVGGLHGGGQRPHDAPRQDRGDQQREQQRDRREPAEAKT